MESDQAIQFPTSSYTTHEHLFSIVYIAVYVVLQLEGVVIIQLLASHIIKQHRCIVFSILCTLCF